MTCSRGRTTRSGLLLLCLAGAGCSNGDAGMEPDLTGSAADGQAGGPNDLRVVDLGPCGGPCTGATPLCDPVAGRCVGCLADKDCALGTVCRMGTCAMGCSGQHGCGDAGLCQLDAGACVECLDDRDCARLGDPERRVCDGARARCVPCRVSADPCPPGTYCRDAGMGNVACVAGCKGDPECREVDGGGDSRACCDHACVDTASSAAHCGGCGNGCGGQPDAVCCASACVHTATDPLACGACGNACAFANAAATCAAGLCKRGPCNAGFEDCDADPKNGCEVSVVGDVKNCGGCGKPCALPNAMASCVAGVCTLASCSPGHRNCDAMSANGCEIADRVDPNNCGNCGSICGQIPNAMAGCVDGKCVVASCAAGFGNCDKMDNNGCETNVTGSLAHCGACGNACPVPANVVTSCAAGMCKLVGCVMGYTDCDNNLANGCEGKLDSDIKNCGACGKVCPAAGQNQMAACAMGVCSLSCAMGFGDCDGNPGNGCEFDVSKDAKNCGACGMVCPMNQPICVNGACIAMLAGAKMWLRADQLGLNEGAKVALWPDSSGNGNDAVQVNQGRQPTFQKAVLNGLPVVAFDGADDMLGFRSVTQLQTISFFIVYRFSAGAIAPSSYYPLIFGGDQNITGQYTGIETLNAAGGNSPNVLDIFAGYGNDARATLQDISAYGQWKIIASVNMGLAHATTVTCNGAVAAMSTTGQSVPMSVQLGNASGTGWGGVGGSAIFGVYAAKVEVAELVVFGTALNQQDRQIVENYLNARYKVF